MDIVELDLRGIVGYTDYFLICTGRSDRQAKAIHDAIHLGMKNEHGLLPARVEGVTEAHWILMDYLDVVVHVFTPETREYYRLEQLWGEAPATRLEPLTVDADAPDRATPVRRRRQSADSSFGATSFLRLITPGARSSSPSRSTPKRARPPRRRRRRARRCPSRARR